MLLSKSNLPRRLHYTHTQSPPSVIFWISTRTGNTLQKFTYPQSMATLTYGWHNFWTQPSMLLLFLCVYTVYVIITINHYLQHPHAGAWGFWGFYRTTPFEWMIFMMLLLFIGRAKWAPHWGVQSRFRVIYIGMSVCLWETIQKVRMSKNAWAKLRGPNMRMLKVCFGWLKPNLKQTELQKLKNRGKKGWIRPENKKTKNHEKQRLATFKRLKWGDDNEF